MAKAPPFAWESGRWYHAMAEMKDGVFVMQIADGPTLFAQRDSFRSVPTSGNGLGVAGPRGGQVELDDLKIWTVTRETQPGRKARMNGLPKLEAIQVKQPKKK